MGAMGGVVTGIELFKQAADLLVGQLLVGPNGTMTGDDLAGELMQIRPKTPIILCTGYSAQINQQQAMAMGVCAFVSKPVLKRDLAETIRAVLERK